MKNQKDDLKYSNIVMDNIIAESSDQMINQLNFGLPEASQYITSHRFVNFFHLVKISIQMKEVITILRLTLALMLIPKLL